MRVVFGPEQTDSTRRLQELLRELTDRMNAPRRLTLLALLGPRSMVGDPEFRAAMDLVEAVALEEVRKRRAQGIDPGRDDIVSMLAHAHYEDGSPMTAQDLRDELITLLLDGPTSTSLAWVFERLLRHPDKLERLREEVRRGEEDVLSGRRRERDAAPVPAGADRGAQAACADGAGRIHGAGGSDGRPLHPPGSSPRGDLSAPAPVHARALAGSTRGDVHVDPVRRRGPPLPGSELCAAGDEAGGAPLCSGRSRCRRCRHAPSR